MRVRKGRTGDAIRCIRINDMIWGRKWKRPGYFHERVGEGELIVAEEGGKVAGYVAFRRHHFGDNWYIEELAVHPDFRRRGAASALLKRVERLCARRKAGLLSSTDSKNRASLNFHRKSGFRREGSVRNMFLDGDTEVIFSKKPK
ncbi:MAG: GNAT family N-acetyltransferase [Candidatus Aenigmarchaeota archaeon]|nr:GNAT family N-acetyltransferase [Candidatus Aenigmarchaeota archaeon]